MMNAASVTRHGDHVTYAMSNFCFARSRPGADDGRGCTGLNDSRDAFAYDPHPDSFLAHMTQTVSSRLVLTITTRGGAGG